MAMAQGGDDYVEKPFRLELLKAKIQAMLRRTYEYRVREQVFLGEKLYFDWGRQALYFGETEIELTKSERRVVAKLAENHPDVVTREELMISRLRGKLKAVCGGEVIETKKGQGYFIP